MTRILRELAKKFVEGEWLYDSQENILKKKFASDENLTKLNLIDAKGFLNAELKNTIIQVLHEIGISHSKGPFGDNDIFSGDIVDDGVLYNIELHDVSEDLIDLLKQTPNITIIQIKHTF